MKIDSEEWTDSVDEKAQKDTNGLQQQLNEMMRQNSEQQQTIQQLMQQIQSLTSQIEALTAQNLVGGANPNTTNLPSSFNAS